MKSARAELRLLALNKFGPLPGYDWADTGHNYKCSFGGLVLSYEDAKQFLELFKQMADMSEEHAALLAEAQFE